MSHIDRPRVPEGEENPYVRLNVMLKIIEEMKAAKAPTNELDGLRFETQAAKYLIDMHYIQHGSSISRPLTQAEKKAGKNGSSQMIMALQLGRTREIDMLAGSPDRQGREVTWIVEAKDTQRVDTSQVPANVQLGAELRYGVMYILASTSGSQENAVRAKFDEFSTGHVPKPPLEIKKLGRGLGELPIVPTSEQSLDDRFNPDNGGVP